MTEENTETQETQVEQVPAEEGQPNFTQQVREELSGGDPKPEEAVTPVTETTEETPAATEEAKPAEEAEEEEELDLDQLLNELLDRRKTQEEQEKVVAEQRQTMEEAYRSAVEDQDFEALGRLASEQIAKQQQADAVRPAIAQEVMADVDSAITAAYGEAFQTLSEEDVTALNRSNFSTEAAFLTAVISKLREADTNRVRSTLASDLKAYEEAARNANTAGKAREDGNLMLGGGTPTNQSDSEDIGAMIRAELEPELRKAFGEE